MFSTDVATRLDYSGIHEINGLRYLFQANCPEGWSYVGLRTNTQHTTRHLKNCTHLVVPSMGFRPVSHAYWQTFQELANDPLVQAMLPIPKAGKKGTGIYYLDESELPRSLDALACLERMSSPSHRCVRSWWGSRPTSLVKELGYTNLHPLIIYNIQQSDIQAVRRLVQDAESLPRTLIIVGRDLIFDQRVTNLHTHLNKQPLDDLIAMPWEQIGANVICNYCRFRPVTTVLED
ncbi:hypothetical protein [Photobacterium sp. GSS17]|uniref:hypothetical protein n=1 Tax=Photobacterium sp. GSS17 TaxID=3020715 RepID=UPI002361BC1B|nr:hypothetical protein [Photobacterium sp. GSS17]